MTATFSAFHGRWIVTCGPFVIGSGKTKAEAEAEAEAERYLRRHHEGATC